jgi:hypothetical protein
MSVKKQIAVRVSRRASKIKDAAQSKPQRRFDTANATDDEDDWMPLAASMTPTRVISEFFESDYDVM